jgi:hypothetical protein
MNFEKKEILEKIKKKDCDWFYEIWNDSHRHKAEVEEAYEQSYGDGNEYTIVLYFTNHDLYVVLEGTYSSWDSPYWSSVSIGEPFEFKETRYRAASLEYLRDKLLNELLGEEGESDEAGA